MASGRLGAIDIAAITNTLLYTVPSGIVATININVVNRNSTSVVLRIAHLDGDISTLANEDYIEYDVVIPANGVLERSGIVMKATHTIVCYSDTANVSIQAWGWEETA